MSADLRLAIGARGFDVLLQFLIEAIVISVVGGSVGIGLGYLVSEGLKYYNNLPALVPLNSVAIAVGFSAFVGIFFGFYPSPVFGLVSHALANVLRPFDGGASAAALRR